MSKPSAVTFHRSSASRTDANLTRDLLTRAARARGLEVTGHVDDPGDLLRRVRAGDVSHLILWSLDRLGRDPEHVTRTLAALAQAGVKVIAIAESAPVTLFGEELRS